MRNFTANIGKEWYKKALEQLDMVEAMTKLINMNSSYTNQYVDAINLSNVDLRGWLAKIASLGGIAKKDFMSRYPYLIDSLKEGLYLRGEDVPNGKEMDETVAQREYRLTWSVSGYTWGKSGTWISLSSDLPTVWTDKKKDSKIKLQNGSAKKSETKWVWPVKSLAEILWVSRQPQVWQQSINDLKKNQDLVTFAKPMNPTKI
jgi:hypothetical protein